MKFPITFFAMAAVALATPVAENKDHAIRSEEKDYDIQR